MLSPIQQWFLFFGAFFGFLGVAAGAFGGHALKERLAPDLLAIFEVGVRYQFYHALALLFVVFLMSIHPSSFVIYAGYCFVVGTILFSGSLFLLVATGIKGFGAITPIGGTLMLVGWLFLILSSFSNTHM
jgi:uncharacterized membrane protein YgdD (TMEM256/DUF423 family)